MLPGPSSQILAKAAPSASTRPFNRSFELIRIRGSKFVDPAIRPKKTPFPETGNRVLLIHETFPILGLYLYFNLFLVRQIGFYDSRCQNQVGPGMLHLICHALRLHPGHPGRHRIRPGRRLVHPGRRLVHLYHHLAHPDHRHIPLHYRDYRCEAEPHLR